MSSLSYRLMNLSFSSSDLCSASLRFEISTAVEIWILGCETMQTYRGLELLVVSEETSQLLTTNIYTEIISFPCIVSHRPKYFDLRRVRVLNLIRKEDTR